MSVSRRPSPTSQKILWTTSLTLRAVQPSTEDLTRSIAMISAWPLKRGSKCAFQLSHRWVCKLVEDSWQPQVRTYRLSCLHSRLPRPNMRAIWRQCVSHSNTSSINSKLINSREALSALAISATFYIEFKALQTLKFRRCLTNGSKLETGRGLSYLDEIETDGCP